MFLLEDGAAQSRSNDGAQCYLLKKKMVEALDIAWDTQLFQNNFHSWATFPENNAKNIASNFTVQKWNLLLKVRQLNQYPFENWNKYEY